MTKTREDKDSRKLRRGARNQQTARAGEYFVAAELNKRGAFAVTFAGNMPKIDLIACNQNQSRTVHIQVKTKRGGKTWHSSTVEGRQMNPLEDETNFAHIGIGDTVTFQCHIGRSHWDREWKREIGSLNS